MSINASTGHQSITILRKVLIAVLLPKRKKYNTIGTTIPAPSPENRRGGGPEWG
jgi:hypothetical protein